MIRHSRGEEFLLFAQHHHAALASKFASHIGGGRFADSRELRGVVLDAIALHDAGWPIHDEDAPTLNGKGEPLDVLEVSMPLATRVWNESVRLAAARDPYAGLLVSLHVLNLSTLAMTHDDRPHERASDDPADLFELNKFQHRQIEQQEEFRRRLGMRTDLPLRLGLAEVGANGDEDRLRFDFGVLRLCDSLSLDACSSNDLFFQIAGIPSRPGGPALTFALGHPAPLMLTFSPWPFALDEVREPIAARRLPHRRFESDEDFRAAYAAAPVEQVVVRLNPS